MKRISEMTDEEFNVFKRQAEKTPLSPFAIFMGDSKGYRYITRDGKQLDKWEVFAMGHQNAKTIISGNCNEIVAVQV